MNNDVIRLFIFGLAFLIVIRCDDDVARCLNETNQCQTENAKAQGFQSYDDLIDSVLSPGERQGNKDIPCKYFKDTENCVLKIKLCDSYVQPALTFFKQYQSDLKCQYADTVTTPPGPDEDCLTRMDHCFILDKNGLPPEDSSDPTPVLIRNLREDSSRNGKEEDLSPEYICKVTRRNEKCLATIEGCQDDPDVKHQQYKTKTYLDLKCGSADTVASITLTLTLVFLISYNKFIL